MPRSSRARARVRGSALATFILAALALAMPAGALAGWNGAPQLGPPNSFHPDLDVAPSGTGSAAWNHGGASGHFDGAFRPGPAFWFDPKQMVSGFGGMDEDSVRTAVNSDGSAVVVYSRDAGSINVVEAALRGPSDTDFQSATLISPPGENAVAPDVAAGGSGLFVATWLSGGSPGTVKQRTFTAAGLGAEADPLSGAGATAPVVDVGRNGHTTIAWIEGGFVKARTRAAIGDAFSSPVTVSDPMSADAASLPDVAVGPAGDSIVVWIQAGRVRTSYRPAGGAFAPAQLVDDLSNDPQVDLGGDGRATIVYERTAPGDTHPSVVVNRRDADGTFADKMTFSGGPSEQNLDPQVDVVDQGTHQGDAVIAWWRSTDPLSSSDDGLRVTKRLGPTGFIGFGQSFGTGASRPRVGIDDAGVATMVWQEAFGGSTTVEGVHDGPPSNTSLPATSGEARVGQVLSANAGGWTGAPEQFTFTWQRCTTAGATCSAYETAATHGPAASADDTYTLSAADEGKLVRVKVSATGNGATSLPVASADRGPVAAASGGGDTTAPDTAINQAPPATTTEPTATFVYASSETGSSFRCTLDGVEIQSIDCNASNTQGGTTVGTYTTPALSAGQHTFTVAAVDGANNADQSPAQHTWTIEGSAQPQPPANTAKPTISNPRAPAAPQPGTTLTVNAGAWTGSPTGYDYKWRRCANTGPTCTEGFSGIPPEQGGSALASSSATHSYTVKEADVNRLLQVDVTAINAAGKSAVESVQLPAPVEPVPQPPINTEKPTISNPRHPFAPRPGTILAVKGGSWSGSPVAYDYKWNRCANTGPTCTEGFTGIPPEQGGSTLGSLSSENAYSVRDEDVGRLIMVRVTAINDVGKSAPESVELGIAVGPRAQPPINRIAPILSPKIIREGNPTEVDNGLWEAPGARILRFGYVWETCTFILGSGHSCTPITQESVDSRFVANQSHVGRQFRVRVTAYNDAGQKTTVYTKVSDPAVEDPKALTIPGKVLSAPEGQAKALIESKLENGNRTVIQWETSVVGYQRAEDLPGGARSWAVNDVLEVRARVDGRPGVLGIGDRINNVTSRLPVTIRLIVWGGEKNNPDRCDDALKALSTSKPDLDSALDFLKKMRCTVDDLLLNRTCSQKVPEPEVKRILTGPDGRLDITANVPCAAKRYDLFGWLSWGSRGFNQPPPGEDMAITALVKNTLGVKVHNRAGQPVSGALVRLEGLGVQTQTKTGANGTATFTGVTPTRAGLIDAFFEQADGRGQKVYGFGQIRVVERTSDFKSLVGDRWAVIGRCTSTADCGTELRALSSNSIARPAGIGNLWDAFVALISGMDPKIAHDYGFDAAKAAAAKAKSEAAKLKAASQNGIVPVGSMFASPADGNANVSETKLCTPQNECAMWTISVAPDGTAKVIASGGGNVIASGGGNVIASGGGNFIVLDKAGHVIASGGGNVIASGGGNVIASGGGNLIPLPSTVIASGGGNVIASGGGNIIASGGGNVIASGGGNVIASGGGNVIASGGGN